MVSASGGTTSCCVNEASSFSISDFWADVRSRLPSSRLAFLIFFRMSRNWLAARFAAEAGLLSSCASPAESFPKEANRSRCCSRRVVSRIRSDIRPTRRLVRLRHFLHKIWKQRGRKSQSAAVRHGSPAHRKLLHPRKRQHSGNVARLQIKDDGFARQVRPALEVAPQESQTSHRLDRPGAT